MRDDVRGAFVEVAQAQEPGAFRALYRFSPDLAVFKGHFPGAPLLPAVYEIEAVRDAAERVYGKSYSIAAVVRSKFRAPIGPGDLIAVEAKVSEDAGGTRVSATLKVDEAQKASITLLLAGT